MNDFELNIFLKHKLKKMENLLIITFGDKSKATEGLNRLTDLDQLGDIIIYNSAIVHKTGNNQFEIIAHEGPDTAALPATGALGGAVIGALGGPLGMAMGMLTGATLGLAGESNRLDFSSDVLDRITKNLGIGRFAIVLDVEEDTESIVDSYMKSSDGIVLRTDVADQYDQYNQDQDDEFNKELDAEEESLEADAEADKADIKLRIENLKREHDLKVVNLKVRAAVRKKQLEDRIQTFDDKIKAAGADTKNKLMDHRKKLGEKLTNLEKKANKAFA
jgi:uncharacterized membrane protein